MISFVAISKDWQDLHQEDFESFPLIARTKVTLKHCPLNSNYLA